MVRWRTASGAVRTVQRVDAEVVLRAIESRRRGDVLAGEPSEVIEYRQLQVTFDASESEVAGL